MVGTFGNGIKAISFDVDDTLWDFDATMRKALGHTLVELRRMIPEGADSLTVDAMVIIRDRVSEELKESALKIEEIRREAFRQTLRNIGLSDEGLAVHLNALYMMHRFKDIQVFPDVVPALDALQDTYALGVLSNGNTHPKHLGLDDRFQFILFASDHGFGKPDPRLFRLAAQRAGCAVNEVLHVGDSLEHDVAGAQQVGMKSVWLNRMGKKNDAGIQADYEMKTLRELVDLLRPA